MERLFEVMGVLAGQEDRGAAGYVVFQRDEQVFQVVERKLVVALVQARPQAPKPRRYLHNQRFMVKDFGFGGFKPGLEGFDQYI